MRVRFGIFFEFGVVHVLVDVSFHGHQLTRLETRTKESTHMRECMFGNFMREVKATALSGLL